MVRTFSFFFLVVLSSSFLFSCGRSKDVCVSDPANYTCYDFLPDSSGACVNGTTKVSASNDIKQCVVAFKPVIYLYPVKESEVTVQLDFHGDLTATYPEFDPVLSGWKVTAFPDGKLINHADNQEYSYLFWEGKADEPVDDFSTGFVVPGSETREFLQEILPQIGLTPREYNEFIVYWYPLMMNNPYNLIHFEGSLYEKTAPLTVTPKPDSLLRVFMTFRSIPERIEVKPQTFTPFKRKGFTVVEWGGSEVPLDATQN
jgi:hypothetical protein